VPVIRVAGEIDHANSQALAKEAAAALAADPARILFDLEVCAYIDSGGVGVLLTLVDEVRDGGWVGIVSANPQVLRVLEITGLTCLGGLKVFSSAAEAEEYCRV
jgi:anti-anti-sigma factor